MLLLVVIIGFPMLTLGVALLFLGEVPFLGKRIPAFRSRLIGGLLVSFMPTAWGVAQAIKAIFGPAAADGPVVISLLFSVYCLVILAILFRVLVPKRERRPVSSGAGAKPNPFSAAEAETEDAASWPEPAPEPAKKPAAQKTRQPPSDSKDPFDFS